MFQVIQFTPKNKTQILFEGESFLDAELAYSLAKTGYKEVPLKDMLPETMMECRKGEKSIRIVQK